MQFVCKSERAGPSPGPSKHLTPGRGRGRPGSLRFANALLRALRVLRGHHGPLDRTVDVDSVFASDRWSVTIFEMWDLRFEVCDVRFDIWNVEIWKFEIWDFGILRFEIWVFGMLRFETWDLWMNDGSYRVSRRFWEHWINIMQSWHTICFT